MGNDITAAGGMPARPLAEITASIRLRVQRMAVDYIGLGRDLAEAKAQVPTGGWIEYVAQNTGFGLRTAENLMRIAREISSDSPLAQLPYTKTLVLLNLPAGEREQFAEAHDAPNKSAAELKRLQQQLQEARAAADSWEAHTREMTRQAEKWEAEAERRQGMIDQLTENPRTVTVHEVPDDYQQLKMKVAHAEGVINETMEELERAEKRAEEAESALRRQEVLEPRRTDPVREAEKAADEFLCRAQLLPYNPGMITSDQDAQRLRLLAGRLLEWAQAMTQAVDGRAPVILAEEAVV